MEIETLLVRCSQGVELRDTTSFGLPGHVRVSVQPPAAPAGLRQAWQHLAKATT